MLFTPIKGPDPIALDPRERGDLPPPLFGRLDAETVERPSISETLSAAFQQENTIAGLGNLWDNAEEFFQSPSLDFNPLKAIEDTPYAEFPQQFLWANNEEQVERIKLRIDERLNNRETLQKSGLLGTVASFAAGILDPIYMIPIGGQAARLLKGGSLLRGAAKSMFKTSVTFGGLETARQAVLQAEDDLKTWGESIESIAFATLMGAVTGGIIGGIRGAQLKRAEGLQRMLDLPAVDQPMQGDPLLAKGWQDVDVVLKREGVFKIVPKVTPGLRTISSEIQASRQASAAIAEHGVILEGEARQAAIETIVRSRTAKLIVEKEDIINKHFADFIKREWVGVSQERMNRFMRHNSIYKNFVEHVGESMRRGDVSDIPEVAAAAKDLRKLSNNLTQDALKLDLFEIKSQKIQTAEKALKKSEADLRRSENEAEKLLKQEQKKRTSDLVNKRKIIDAEVKILKEALEESKRGLDAAKAFKPDLSDLNLQGTAKSHFARLYNKALIRRDPVAFESAVADYLIKSEGISAAEAKDVARQVYESVAGSSDGRARQFDPIIVRRGSLKDRTLLIPDEVLEPWLISDASIVMDRFITTLVTDIELKRTLGDVTGEKVVEAIRNEQRLLEAQNPGRVKSLKKKGDSDVKDILGMIDRLRGVEGLTYENHAGFAVFRTIRNLNNARYMGGISLNAFTDVGQVVLQQGLMRTMGSVTKLFLLKTFKPSAYNAVKEDLKAMAIGVDSITGSSRRSLFELGTGDPIGGRIEQASQRLANFTFKAGLMAHVDGITKRVAGYTAGDRIFRNVFKGADKLSRKELAWMRNLGVAEKDYAALRSQFRQFSKKESGFRLFNTAKWSNADASRVFESALKKTERLSVITPGVGEAPLLFDNPAFQLMFQYKRFVLAAMQRSLIPALQRTDAGVMAGITIMATGGIFREVIKDIISGKDPSERPLEDVIMRGIVRSDVVAYVPDLWGVGKALAGENPYGQDAIKELLGPSGQFIGQAVPGTAQLIKNLVTDEQISKQQIRAFRSLLPFQNLFYINFLLTKTEESVNNKLGNP